MTEAAIDIEATDGSTEETVTEFEALDAELELIETDLLEPFDEIESVQPPAVELPPIEPIEIDLPVDLDLLGPPPVFEPGS